MDYLLAVTAASFLVVCPLLIALGYAIALRKRLLAHGRFVVVAAWLSYGIYGALLALSLPVQLGMEVALPLMCTSSESGPPSSLCALGRWLYEAGFYLGVGVWLALSVATVHKLGAARWNQIAVAMDNNVRSHE